MLIKPSASIRQNYNEISLTCHKTKQPIYLTKNGAGDLVVMDIESFTRREKMLSLRESLLAAEEDRATGFPGCDVDQLESELDEIIAEANIYV